MNARCLYIIMSIVSLLFLTNCRDEEDVRPSEGKRTITVNLGIAMSRVVEGTDLGEGTPSDMKVWIFEHGTENLLAYLPDSDPVFSGSDALGGLVNTKEYVVEVDNSIQALDFYVVLNSGNGTDLDLDENSTPSEIKEATFTGISTGLEDNQVPAYGSLEGFDVSERKNTYTVPSIELTRAVGKLELFFTKENTNSHLMINSITLEHVPDKGYLAPPASYDELQYNGKPIDLFSSATSIDAVLTTDRVATAGNFSEIYEQDNTTFQRLDLNQDYLLENPNGGIWSEVGGNNDYTYTDPYDPDKQSDNDYTDGATRYKMTVTYQTAENGEEKKQVVYLPEIKRNYWNKIFARVKDDGKLTIQYQVLLWEEVTSSIGWEPEFDFGGNAPMAAWRIKDKKIDPDFRNATEGDEEATCCYVLYPRFGRSNDKSDHGTLVKRSSYAAFYFCLQEPDGAVWEAYLSNPDDFELSTGGNYDSDGDGTNDKHCVMTGIARKEPYQIQVGAKNYWTDADETVTDDTEGRDYGWDVLSEWGKEIKESGEQYDVHTDLYIRVSLDNGITWHNLPINRPDYSESDKEDQPYYLEKTYWHNNRRFAGGDDYIRIWQLKAVKDGDFVDMVDNLDEKWAIKAHWKGED